MPTFVSQGGKNVPDLAPVCSNSGQPFEASDEVKWPVNERSRERAYTT